MQLLEHVGKDLLAKRGVSVPVGGVATSRSQAERLARDIGTRVAVKAQVPTGGRGRAGGVVIVDSDRAGEAADELLGTPILGHVVGTVLVEEAVTARRELYVGIVFDARTRLPLLLVGADGGVDIESEAAHVARTPFDLRRGVRPAHVWRAGLEAGLDRPTVAALVDVAVGISDVFRTTRAQSVEINPLLDLGDGELLAADVRVVPDAALSDAATHPLGFDYVILDEGGDVGLITTGAGASMLLIDLLTRTGARPIDFCDIRTGSFRGDRARLDAVLDDLLARPGLRCLAMNVFAGITDLDEVTNLLLESLTARTVHVPFVVRVEGRGAEAARGRLAAAGCEIVKSPQGLVEAVTAHLAIPVGGVP